MLGGAANAPPDLTGGAGTASWTVRFTPSGSPVSRVLVKVNDLSYTYDSLSGGVTTTRYIRVKSWNVTSQSLVLEEIRPDRFFDWRWEYSERDGGKFVNDDHHEMKPPTDLTLSWTRETGSNVLQTDAVIDDHGADPANGVHDYRVSGMLTGTYFNGVLEWNNGTALVGYAYRTFDYTTTPTNPTTVTTFRIPSLDELEASPHWSVDTNATCLELLTFIHGTAADYDVGQAATFELSLKVHEHVYYLSCPELIENDAVGLQGNPILLRIAVDDADMVHYRSCLLYTSPSPRDRG